MFVSVLLSYCLDDYSGIKFKNLKFFSKNHFLKSFFILFQAFFEISQSNSHQNKQFMVNNTKKYIKRTANKIKITKIKNDLFFQKIMIFNRSQLFFHKGPQNPHTLDMLLRCQGIMQYRRATPGNSRQKNNLKNLKICRKKIIKNVRLRSHVDQ